MRTQADRMAEAARYQQMTEEATRSAYYSQRHGGPYDRGTADSFYGRGYNPHYFVGDSYSSTRLELVDMSASEIAAYTAGYRNNEESGERKEY